MRKPKKIILKDELISLTTLDISFIKKGYLEWINKKENNQFLHYKKKYTENELREYILKSIPPSCYFFAITILKENRYIGNIRLSSIDYYHKSGVYGRMIGGENTRGKGYGSRALRLLSNFAFTKLKLNRIQTGVVETNISSIKSNINAGARIEAVINNNYYDGKKYRNSILFSIINKKTLK